MLGPAIRDGKTIALQDNSFSLVGSGQQPETRGLAFGIASPALQTDNGATMNAGRKRRGGGIWLVAVGV